ncbi:FMN-dependent NADH-azoreductase [Devosia sp. UYZn731]|uniref:FMN-dependent NADH-azoreductase n=1 Tax=Devosia sp. UYZn731 TaxID=3156345 RepID=UPI00339B085A
MKTLLHVVASPRGERSHSSRAAEKFVAQLVEQKPGFGIDRLDLWEVSLPAFDGELLDAKYAVLGKTKFSPEQELAWQAVEAMVRRLDAADALLISTPMWNMSIPYRLKHYLDLVTQPGLSFAFNPEAGYRPLLRSRPAIAIIATSGDFSTGSSWGRPNLAGPHLQQALKFIGFLDPEVMLVGPTVGEHEKISNGVSRVEARLAEVMPDIRGALS